MKAMTEEHFAILRRHMVEVIAIHTELMGEELGKAKLDERVMAVLGRVPRHLFVPAPLHAYAYQDTPLPIGFDKTISQPFLVALMTDLLDPRPHEAVLEVGTGLGYQTAVLASLAGRVWSVEVVEEFAAAAEQRLRQLGHANLAIRVGDGDKAIRIALINHDGCRQDRSRAARLVGPDTKPGEAAPVSVRCRPQDQADGAGTLHLGSGEQA